MKSSAVLEGCKKFEQATPICDKIGLHSYQFYFLQLSLGSGAEYFPRKSRGIQVQGKLQEARCKKTGRDMVQTVAAFLTVSRRVLPGSSDPLRCLCSISIPTQSMPSIRKISSPRPSFPESWAGPPITCGEGGKRRAKGCYNKLFYSIKMVRTYGKGWQGRRPPGERVDACMCRAAEFCGCSDTMLSIFLAESITPTVAFVANPAENVSVERTEMRTHGRKG